MFSASVCRLLLVVLLFYDGVGGRMVLGFHHHLISCHPSLRSSGGGRRTAADSCSTPQKRAVSLRKAAVSLESSSSSDPSHRKQQQQQDASSPPASTTGAGVGLYRPFAERVWQRLEDRCCEDADLLQPVDIPRDLSFNTAPAAGPPPQSTVDGTTMKKVAAAAAARVDISIRAMQQRPSSSSPICYARLALLETLSNDGDVNNKDDDSAPVATTGIQVLNVVIFPAAHLDFPVWGADFVTLPGNKHLLLLDAQPMGDAAATDWSHGWKEWYEKHKIAKTYPWGGDLPEKVQPYVSKYALWTRLGAGGAAASDNNSAVNKDPIEQIKSLTAAFEEHLDIYLDLLLEQQVLSVVSSNEKNRQRDYIQYRLDNDPARPMLKRLFGEEWTEKVLNEVLFPQS